MLRKVELLSKMAAPTSDAIQQLHNDIKQLTTKGREAAFSLFTLAHAVSTVKTPPIDIANKLFAIAGLLPGLTEALAIKLPHDTLLFSASQLEELSKSLNACTEVARGVDDVVAALSEAVWSADTISSEPDTAFEKFETFVSGSFVQETLESCFRDVVAAVADAREKDLFSRCYNSDSQYFETIRLQESLKHTKFLTSSGFRANASEMASVQLPIRTEEKESQQPPDSSSEQQNDSKKLPMSVASFNSWPPHRVSFANQEEYDAQVKLGHEIIDKYNKDLDAEPAASSSGAPINTPETTRASTPETGATENATWSTTAEKETTPQPKTEESKDNNRNGTSVEDAAQEILSKGKEKQTEPKVETSPTKAVDATSQPTFSFGSAKPISPVYTPYNKSTYREAYILRPLCDEFRGVIEWTYKVEQLRIDAEQVDAHVKKLGPDYSVLDSIGELHPEQMRLVQLRAKQRHGQLVSVQLARAVDMATTMGILQVKPVIFVVKSIWPPEPEKTESQKPLFPSSGGGGLFGGGTGTGGGFGGFGQPALPKTSESTGLWGGWGGKPRDAKSYTQTLQEQGEVCTYVEDAGGDRLAHYQTITPTIKKDVSFEELRLHDVAAGRTGPMKHNGFTYPWDASSSKDTEGLFGKSSSSATPSGRGSPGSTTANNTTGLFGAPPHSLGIPNSSTNHFSAPPATSSGNLFGAPPSTTKNTGSLFGAPLHSTDNHTICTCNIPHAPGPCTEPVKSKSTNPFGAPPLPGDNDLVCMCGVHHWRPGTCPRPVKRTSFGLFNPASAPTTSSNLFSAPSANSTATPDTTREIPQADRSKVIQCCMPVIPGQPSGPGLFNQPPKTGLFGNGTAQQPRPAGEFGLFGGGFGSNNTTSTQSNPRPTGGLFGGSFGIDNILSTQPNPPTQGGFGGGFRIKNNTNTQSSSPPPGGLFGQPTTPAPPPTQSIFSQPTPQIQPRGLPGTSTSTIGPLTPNQKLSCKSCFTSLVFHPEPEQKAGICDVCAKKKDTGCWLCVRQLRVVTPTNKMRNINEEEGSATGGLKNWGPEQIAAGFGATEKREVEEEKKSSLFGPQSQTPNPFNPRSGSVLTTPPAEPGKKDDTKNTQTATKEASYSSTSAGGGAGVGDK